MKKMRVNGQTAWKIRCPSQKRKVKNTGSMCLLSTHVHTHWVKSWPCCGRKHTCPWLQERQDFTCPSLLCQRFYLQNVKMQLDSLKSKTICSGRFRVEQKPSKSHSLHSLCWNYHCYLQHYRSYYTTYHTNTIQIMLNPGHILCTWRLFASRSGAGLI